MTKTMKRFITAGILFSVFSICSVAAATGSGASAFVEACKAYTKGEWSEAKFMLKKAVTYPENMNPDTYYMLISAEIYDNDNRSALDDCNFFIDNFPQSMYYSRICYQKGRLLYTLGEYEKAVIVLSDFCHRYGDDDLYSYALFYIGESLFAGYKYDEAGSIYEQIVNEYPESSKTPAAQYRLETILQRGREEKLLYLLKQTGEEYLAAKEEYERQLRLYNSESIDTTRQKLNAAQAKNEELELKIVALEAQLEELKNNSFVQAKNQIEEETSTYTYNGTEEEDVPAPEPYDENRDRIRLLKQKALEAQKMLDDRNSADGGGL